MRTGRLYYGWIVVAAAFSVLFLSYGIQFSYGVFVKDMADDLDWTRTQTAWPYAVYVFVYSALSSATGSATDRWGPRLVVGSGALLLGLGWGLSSVATEPWHLYLTMGIVAAVGMSVTWVPCNATVVRWFTRLRGTAVAIGSSGGSVGNLVVPTVAAVMVGAWGWRVTMAVLAAGVALLLIAFARLMVRDPETMGLYPDGVVDAPPLDELVGGYSVAEVRWTTPFLVMVTMYLLSWSMVFMPFVHLAPYAEDLGLSAVAGATVVSAIGIGGVSGRLLAGSASDRIGRFPALVTMFGLEVVAFLGFTAATGLALLWPAAVLFGFGYGGTVALFAPLCGDVFGRAHAASIVGAGFARAGAPAAIGPLMAAWIFDTTGSYEAAFLIGAGLNATSLVLVLVLARLRDALPPRPVHVRPVTSA